MIKIELDEKQAKRIVEMYNDFKNIYQNICNRVRGIYNQNYSRHSSELTARMIELDSKIARKHNDDELKINSIKVLIKSLENKD